jgi:hypothetical protein
MAARAPWTVSKSRWRAEHSVPVPAVLIDQPGAVAQLALAVARERDVPVAYVSVLGVRRAADLYPGEAKTYRRDAFVIADTARTRRRQVHRFDVGSDELLKGLRILNGFDIGLAADQTRLTSRLRDVLTSVPPAPERALGARLAQPGLRDLLAKHPTPAALPAAGHSGIERIVAHRSPCLAKKVAGAVVAALDAQSVRAPVEATVGRVIT